MEEQVYIDQSEDMNTTADQEFVNNGLLSGLNARKSATPLYEAENVNYFLAVSNICKLTSCVSKSFFTR